MSKFKETSVPLQEKSPYQGLKKNIVSNGKLLTGERGDGMYEVYWDNNIIATVDKDEARDLRNLLEGHKIDPTGKSLDELREMVKVKEEHENSPEFKAEKVAKQVKKSITDEEWELLVQHIKNESKEK